MLSEPEQEAIVEIETSWMREGRQLGREEGRQEGREEGRQAGMAALVSRQLNRRLGTVDSSMLEQVQKLKPEQLEELSEALLDFATAADLERWLSAQPHPTDNPTA